MIPNSLGQDVYLTLDFACCLCAGPVSVTVKCGGPGLSAETDNGSTVVSTSVPCPGCGLCNQLFFDPTGAVRAVQPFRCFRPLPVPSDN